MQIALAAALLALCAALAASAPAAAQAAARDSAGREVLLQADQVQFDDALGVATATGNVELAQGNRVLMADTVSYNQRANVVTASGNVVLLEPSGEVMFAEYAEMTDDMREGFLRGLRVLLAEDARLAAAGGVRRAGSETELSRAVYTPCVDCKGRGDRPLWEVRARRVVHNSEKQEVTYHSAWLDMAGIPVMWVPYLSHPDPSVKRRTGFLAPVYGVSSNVGTSVQTPYFWALSEDKDITFDPILMVERAPLLTGEYRQAYNDGELRFRPSVARDGFQGGSQKFRGHIDGTARFDASDTWRYGSRLWLTSDDTYLSRYSFQRQDILTSRLYAEGFHARNYAVAESIYFQDLRPTGAGAEAPFVMPRMAYSFVGEPGRLGGRANFDADMLALTRVDGASSRRISAVTGWQIPWYSRFGSITTFSTSLQTDIYSVERVSSAERDSEGNGVVGRAFPMAALDWRLPFVRDGGNTRQVIEPIAAFVAAPFSANPSRIPNEDSADFEFDETNLFRPGRFGGRDRVEEGQHVAYGVRTGTYGARGGRTTLFIGQSFQFQKESSLAGASGLEEDFSDIVARLEVVPNRYLSAVYKTRIDVDSQDAARSELALRAGGRALAVDLFYFFFNQQQQLQTTGTQRRNYGDREEITAQLSSQLTDRWSASIDTRRDIATGAGTISWGGTVRYVCDCATFGLDFRRDFTRDRDIGPNDSIVLRMVLKTLGEFGGSVL
ncbi:MAG: LPS-assembly protein LptD [Alphaproteobacteria bacterium]